MINLGNWNRLPSMPFNETGKRQIFTGENTMIVRNVIEPGFPSFSHSHPHEQLLFIMEGFCEVTVGEETVKMGPGDMVKIAPNVVHDLAVIGEETVVNFDIFSPVREDFIEAMDKYTSE